MIFNKKKRFNIIPLGQNCMPRVILTRYGIKPHKFQGELTYPFDLAVFGIPEITKTLKTDFNEFFDNLEYKNNCWIKAPNCIEFCHDKRFKENDKQKLIDLYSKRIENFRNAINDETPILFVQILGDYEEIEQQYNELKRIIGDKPFKFIIIDTENIVPEINLENVFIKNIPLPNKEYKLNWWRKEYYTSKDGRLFEKQIAEFCKEILNYL